MKTFVKGCRLFIADMKAAYFLLVAYALLIGIAELADWIIFSVIRPFTKNGH